MFVFWFVKWIPIAQVAVWVLLFTLGAPYSTGNLNCFSAFKLWELINRVPLLMALLSIKFDNVVIPPENDAQADYSPI